MKKILSVTLVLALLLLIFAGCQSSDSQLQQPGGAVSGQGSATAGDAVPDETPAKEITGLWHPCIKYIYLIKQHYSAVIIHFGGERIGTQEKVNSSIWNRNPSW